MERTIQLQSIITCPICSHQKEETMPTGACQFSPKIRLGINLRAGYKTNINQSGRDFFYLVPEFKYVSMAFGF